MLMRDLILAVDGGGSASRVCVYTQEGSELLKFEIASLSAKAAGVGGVVWALAAMLDKIGTYKDRLACGVMGLSGLDSSSDVVTMTGMIAASGLLGPSGLNAKTDKVPYGWRIENPGAAPLLLCSDAILPLFSTGANSGSALIAGTGSVALHVDETGEVERFGGWGYQVSDEGAGSWIGAEFLRKALRIADYMRSMKQRAKLSGKDRDLLHEAYQATHLGFNDEAIAMGVEQLSPMAESDALCTWAAEHTDPRDYANLAKNVLESDVEGCRELSKRAAKKLAWLARCAYVSPKKPMVMAGGLFKNQRFFEETGRAFARSFPKKSPKVVVPTKPAIWGAFELAQHTKMTF